MEGVKNSTGLSAEDVDSIGKLGQKYTPPHDLCVSLRHGSFHVEIYHSTSAGLEDPLPVPYSGGNFASHGVVPDRYLS